MTKRRNKQRSSLDEGRHEDGASGSSARHMATIAFLVVCSFCLGVFATHQFLLSRHGGVLLVADNKACHQKKQSNTPHLEETSPILPGKNISATITTMASPDTSSQFSAYFHPARPSMLTSIYNKIQPRVWDPWPNPSELPCFPPDDQLGWKREWDRKKGDVGNHSHLGGLFFVKPSKVGGSTASGVHIRIMHRLPQRLGKTFPVCRGNSRHANAAPNYAAIHDRSFLWSVLRDPTQRATSEFFHFGVSRAKVEPTDKNFLKWLKLLPSHRAKSLSKIGHYGDILDLVKATKKQPAPMNPLDVYKNILHSYNFIGVTERMDESLVVLKELLGLETSDVLHLNAKKNGAWDDGKSSDGCTFIMPSYLSPFMQRVFASQEWLSRVQYDMALHVAVNQSLDMTIDQRIGRHRFELALRQYQQAQQLVQDLCLEETRFPCTAGGEKRNETDCYLGDNGCGYPCIDRVVAQLGLQS